MNQRSALSKIAEELTEAAQNRASALRREIVELEKETAKKKSALDAANLAHERLANYTVLIGTEYQCPRCWIESEVRSALRPTGRGLDNEDVFACHVKGHEIAIPTGMGRH
jgi:hypothetical protein